MVSDVPPTRRGSARAVGLLGLLLSALVLGGAVFLARAPALEGALHLALEGADPAPDDSLDTAPGELRLSFTEAVDPELATVGLTGPGGEVSLSEPRRGATPRDLVAAITTSLVPGEYTVRWRVVGADGHPVSGDFGWVLRPGAEGASSVRGDTVAGDAPAGDTAAGEQGAGALDPAGFDAESPGYVVVRWLTFLALLALLGAVAYGALVLPLARRRAGAEPSTTAPGRRAAARLGLMAAVALLVLAVARLAAQAYAVHGDGAFTPDRIAPLLSGSRWAWGWILQVVAAAAAVPAFLAARRNARSGWLAAAIAAVLLAFTPALSGHAAAVERLAPLPVVADGVHVLAAGGWLGTLLVLLAVAVRRSTTSPPTGSGAAAAPGVPLAPLVTAFSGVALLFAAVVVATGVFSAWLHLPSVPALWRAEYGRALLLKVALVVPVLATGAYNWRRVRPALGEGAGREGAAALRRSGWVEVTLAVLVLLATALLVATPTPDPATHAGSGGPP